MTTVAPILRRAVAAAALLVAPASALHAQNETPDVRLTTNQLWDQNTTSAQKADFAAKYLGKTLEVTGPLWMTHWYAGSDSGDVQLSVNGAARAVICMVGPAMKDSIAKLQGSKAVFTVRGRWARNWGYVKLEPCAFSAGSPPPPAAVGPANPPLGKYAVKAMANMNTFAWQYDLVLLDRSRYRVQGVVGIYAYDPRTHVLRFTTGNLHSFTGLYYTSGRNAEGPTIALDANGRVPDPEHASRGQYQYGYYRPGER